MRRERRRRREGENSYSVFYIAGSLLAVGIISFVITFIVYGNKMEEQSMLDTQKLASLVKEENDNAEPISTQIGKTVDESQNEINNLNSGSLNDSTSNKSTSTNTKKDETKNTSTSKTTQTKEETKVDDTKASVFTFVLPVEGDILKEYAKDNLVYSNTLEEWTTHLGIDIKADKTTVVKSSADGTIKSIKSDPRYGLSIIIEHKDGYETMYANLLSAEFVKVGEKVSQGQSIGTVGDTAPFEIVDGAHLHFEISKDGENINPKDVIK